jgi:hypothetical protein
MRKRKLLFSLLALGLGAFLGGSGAMAQSTNNGWNAILEQTQTTSASWTALSAGSTTGMVLGAAESGSNATYYYYITESLNFTNNRTDNDGNGNSGLKIHGTVYLYIPTGLTITCEGANADGRTGAGAGIELASGNTLYIIGGGTVNAIGGSAENGRNGDDGTDANGNSSWLQTGTGGSGGNGGGGAGAGIGTRGGTGGTGGSGGYGYTHDWNAYNGTNGSDGTVGGSAGAMGNLYVANGITVTATGGNAGSSGAGGGRGKGYIWDGGNNYTVAGGGGGGAGGFGGAAANIGTGGPGGGGGGGGAGGAQDWKGGQLYDVTAYGGNGGTNGDGTSAANGAEANTTRSAYENNLVVSENSDYTWQWDDWNNPSGDCAFGVGGAGGGKGNNASSGTQDTGNLTYTITYHWAVPEATTTTVQYSPSTGASVILPQNTLDGYQWALGVYGKDCHVSGEASEFTTASKEFYGGNMSATASRTIYLKDVYGNLDFYEVKSVCMLKNSGSNTQEIGDFFVADNNPHANAPKWPITVRLQDRTLYKDNCYNSICLPFSMTKDQIAASPLASATIKKLNTTVSGYYPSGQVNKAPYQNYDYGHPVVLFWFDDVDINGEGNVIEAGKPYLVKWAYGTNLVDDTSEPEGQTVRHELDFNYVTVKATGTAPGSWVGAGTTNGDVNFVGTFSSTQVPGDNKTILILGPNNSLYYPSEALSIAACRGYFTIPDAAVSPSGAPQIVLGFGDGETTSINVLQGSGFKVQGSDTYYNLNGQRLSAPQKGINIVNGKKMLVK